ncbi:MBL fold metallo-hydrolase [Mycobacterium sp. URHB0021]
MTASGGSAIGRAGDPSAVRSLALDDVEATYVVDGVLHTQPAAFFPAMPRDYWSARPELFAAAGTMPMSAGGLLIERGDTTLLIDAGVGMATVDFPGADVDCGAMIDVLEMIGRRPEDIDVVAFTHLHFDHAGWAYANSAKMFPHARYVIAAREWARFADGTHPCRDKTTPWHVVWQLRPTPTRSI